MSEDLTKKAAEMLLKGATLLSEHCPYCKGVRVMKDGHALCISCGREPEKKRFFKRQNPTKSKIILRRKSGKETRINIKRTRTGK